MAATTKLAPLPENFYKALPHSSTHDPRDIPGEKPIGDLLQRLGIPHEHEGLLFPLRYQLPNGTWRTGGFCPDFHLPATSLRPALNVEVTFADRLRPAASRKSVRTNLNNLAVKRTKIELTRKHYQIETVLITWAVFLRIMRDETHLDRLIRQAVAHHHRYMGGLTA